VWPEVATAMLAHKTELKVNGRSKRRAIYKKKTLEYRFCSINEVFLFIEVFWKQVGVIGLHNHTKSCLRKRNSAGRKGSTSLKFHLSRSYGTLFNVVIASKEERVFSLYKFVFYNK